MTDLVHRPSRPLLVTADPSVLDDLLRLAATAGVEAEVAADAATARRSWSSAPCVVVGPDAAAGCRRARLPRRAGVVLLGDDVDDPSVWVAGVELGAEAVLHLPGDEDRLVARLGEAAEEPADGVVVAVVGGRGGAGATVLATALAAAASRAGRGVLLVDGDPLGGGIDLVLGGEGDRGLRWGDLVGTRGRVSGTALAAALPRAAGLPGLAVLSCDRGSPGPVPAEAMAAVVSAGRRACDLVVVDLPRTPDEAARHVLGVATVALLVVPAEVRAAAAACRVAAGVGLLCADLRLVVRGPGPGGLRGPDLARALGLPLAGVLRPEPGLDAALDRGELPGRRGRGPLAELSARLVEELVPQTVRRAA